MCGDATDLEHEIRIVIPAIIGAPGIITKCFKKRLGAIPGKHSVDSIPSTTVLGRARIIRKVLRLEAMGITVGGVPERIRL
jgi:hypothetical protein